MDLLSDRPSVAPLYTTFGSQAKLVCVCEDYSALSAPKSTLLKSASQTSMVFKKRSVCTTACGELMSVYAMYAFSVT